MNQFINATVRKLSTAAALTDVPMEFICEALLSVSKGTVVITFGNLPHMCVYRDSLSFVQRHQTYTVCHLQGGHTNKKTHTHSNYWDQCCQFCCSIQSLLNLSWWFLKTFRKLLKKQVGSFLILPWCPPQEGYAVPLELARMEQCVDHPATAFHGYLESALHSAAGTGLCIQNRDPWGVPPRWCLLLQSNK